MNRFGRLEISRLYNNKNHMCICGEDKATYKIKKEDLEVNLCNQCLFDLQVAMEDMTLSNYSKKIYDHIQIEFGSKQSGELIKIVEIKNIKFVISPEEFYNLLEKLGEINFQNYLDKAFVPVSDFESGEIIMRSWELRKEAMGFVTRLPKDEHTENKLKLHRCCLCHNYNCAAHSVIIDQHHLWFCEKCFIKYLNMKNSARSQSKLNS